MSLLNDMLKDLNNKDLHKHATPVLIPSADKHWVNNTISLLCGLLFIVMVILVMYLWRQWPKPIEPTPIPPVIKPHVIPSITLKRNILEEGIAQYEHNLDNQAIQLDNNPIVPKKMVQYTPKDWYNEHMNQALEAIEVGNDQQAIDLLTTILTKFPAGVEARENLTALYLAHGELTLAYAVLEDGLKIEPYNLHLTIMKARLLVEQGRQREALALLEKFNPDINATPEYYALLAVIFESLGRTTEAGSIYQALVKVEPSNGQYWLGLGVALEHKKSTQQALEAYQQASQCENTQPAVLAYANNRIKTLQG